MVEKNKFGRTKTKRGERARPASGRGKPFLFFQDWLFGVVRHNVVFVGTKNLLADGLTKSLPRPRFEELWTQIGVTELVSKKE